MCVADDILIEPEAEALYLKLEGKCAAQFRETLVGRYVATEIQRVVLAIANDPAQPWLQAHRIPEHDGSLTFVVVVKTPTGVDYDAAVFWTYRASDLLPVILAIELEYRR